MDSSRIAALLAPFLVALPLSAPEAGAGRVGVFPRDDLLSATQLSQLSAYLGLLLRWNARMNLTAVRDPEQIVTRHFGESLFAACHLYSQPATDNSQLIDIGSGAGFPGLPIKIFAPALGLALLESNQRKATFLREVARALHLNDVEVSSTRAEQYQIAHHKSHITNLTVTIRAVEKFESILPTALRLLQTCSAPQRRLALLIGAAQLERARHAGLTWSDPLPVPQSSRRVLLIGTLPVAI